jgi:hypothetical protein
MQHKLVVIDVSRDNLSVSSSSIKKPSWVARLLKMGQGDCLETSVTSGPHCVTSQKSEDLIYTAEEAWKCRVAVLFYVFCVLVYVFVIFLNGI